MKKAIFIPIKQNSERVPGKNFRNLPGLGVLWQHTVYRLFGEYPIYINTDSEDIKNHFKNTIYKNIFLIERKKEYIGDHVSVSLLIEDFWREHPEFDIIAQVHVTSPFLTKETLYKAMEFAEDSSYTSVGSVTTMKQRFWKENFGNHYPLNHDCRILLPTQKLEPLYFENSAFYILNNREAFLKNNTRFDEYSYFYEINYPEDFDIDTEEDWKMAKVMASMYQ